MTKFKNKKKGQFRSTFEYQINQTMPKRRGVRVTYEENTIQYNIPHSYIPDFTVHLPNGSVFYIEVKGWFRQADKTKMRYVKICNPDLDIRLVFPRKNKKDIDWCERYGFPYAIERVPREWLHG